MHKRDAWVAVGVAAVLGWVLGVALLGLHPRLPSVGVLGGLALIGGVLMASLGVAAARRPPWGGAHAAACALLASTLLAHGVAGLRTEGRLQDRLPHALEGVPLLLVGRVAELPRRSPIGVQFAFEVESARGLDGRDLAGVPRRVWLGWWTSPQGEDAFSAETIPEPAPGERWQLPVSLKRPHGTLNPGAFDAERWFLEQDLGASGSVAAAFRGQARRLGAARPVGLDPEGWRSALRHRIDAHVADRSLAGLVAGLTIGDQSAVDAADWQRFRDAGVAHALSISGLHITAFAALATPLAAWAWAQWPRACLLWPASSAGAVVGWAFALAYALLAGWGLPAQRTVAMLAVVTLARAAQLNWPPLLVWLAAAAPVVVWDPWAVSQAGFWLSFAAVGLLLLSSRPTPKPVEDRPVLDHAAARPGWMHWCVRASAARLAGFTAWPWLVRGAGAVGSALRTQWATTIGLAPLAAACFHQLSLVSVLANLVALPWITLVLTPLCMLGVLWPPVWSLLPAVVDPLRAGLGALVAWPGAVLTVPASGWAELSLALFGGALALMNLPMRLRLMGILLMLPLLWPPPRVPASGRFEVRALDVGQGSAVLVRTRQHALLMDAGPAWGESQDAGERVVLPVLRHLGVRGLDLLVVTHRDIDHVGGAASVLKGLPVQATLSSLEPGHPLRRFPMPHRTCRRGQQWEWDGVRFDVLHPFGDEPPKAPANTISCVLRVQDSQGRSVLLTGDIERDQERALVGATDGTTPLRSDALVVPHHGSKTSSTEPFLQAVQPRWALAQAGYRNRHGHPAASVAATYAALQIPLAASPWCGAWSWDGEGPPRCWREQAARHWHDRKPDP